MSEEGREKHPVFKVGSRENPIYGAGLDCTIPALDLGVYLRLGALPISTTATTCRNRTELVARSPQGDFLIFQPWRMRLSCCEAATGFLMERELKV